MNQQMKETDKDSSLAVDYYCGGCQRQFQSINLLFDHMQEHAKDGSFYYKHSTQTAFPLAVTKGASIQIDNTMENFESNYNDETEVLGSLINESQEEIKTENMCLENTEGCKVVDCNRSDSSEDETNSDLGNLINEDTQSNTSEKNFHSLKNAHVCVKRLNDNHIQSLSEKAYSKEASQKITQEKETKNRHKTTKQCLVQKTVTYKKSEREGHTQVIRIECKECGIEMLRKSLKQHLINIHTAPRTLKKRGPRKYDMYNCERCDRLVPIKDKDRHEWKHAMKSGDGPVVCEVCGIVCKGVRGLNSHMVYHSASKSIETKKCAIVTTSGKEMKIRKRSHYRKFTCKICGGKFARQSHVLIHVKNVHLKEKRFLCDQCGKEFLRKENMVVHRRIHFEPTFECKCCGRKFCNSGGLRRHEKIHTGYVNYYCHICNRGFIQSTPYWTHMEKKHSISRSEAKALHDERVSAATN